MSECSKDKRKMWHLRGFPWCIASVLSYVSRALWYRCALLRALCDVHCTTCTLLCALCKMHCATFLADLEVLQACAEQMQYRSCPCMIATVMSSSVHTFSSAWCSLVQLDAAYKFSAWWSSNAFQVDAMFKFLAWYNSCVPRWPCVRSQLDVVHVFHVVAMYEFLAWCSKVSSLVTGSHIWRHLRWSSRCPDVLLPFLSDPGPIIVYPCQ